MVKVGIKELDRTVWFNPRHYALMLRVAYALWKENRPFTIVFKET